MVVCKHDFHDMHNICVAKKVQIESRTCQACLSNYAEMQPFLCKITQILSYKHHNHQKIIQYSDNLTIIHTIPRYFWCKTKERCKITSNPPNRPIWFVDAQLWFVNAAFCISNTQHLLKIASISTLFA